MKSVDEDPMTIEQKQFLRDAFRVARTGLAQGNPPFGAVIVVDGEIRIEAFNTSKSESNFLLHGEINCLSKARDQLTAVEFSRAVLYSSCEPCPMCSGAIYWSGIRSVVYGSSRESLTRLRKFGLNIKCSEVLHSGSETVLVTGPALEDEIMPLYEEYYGGRSL